ncbi:uncharacterized protein LOC110944315 isoform X2 [Helianthus annuus]|uniref:uncharacterized protein LOC110944315 isoform X2 n=1 Tax=Helianthus annuus TaxID=4232 RepID=UPI001652C1DC|nr:uncharacterized protein LOC110944315 isoform X2 [Helianthus annuus]
MLRLYLQWLRWNSALHYHPPVYAPAALSMNFLLLDLGLFPNTAGRFGISLEEVSRFPDMHPATKSSDITDITKKFLCRHLNLTNICLIILVANRLTIVI